MGWILSVEICQRFHRNVRKRGGALPAQIEIRRSRAFPDGAARKFLRGWKIYSSDFKQAEIFEPEEMEVLETTVPNVLPQAATIRREQMERADEAYEERGAQDNPEKEKVAQLKPCSPGERMDDARGDRRGTKGYDQELIVWTLGDLSVP